MSDARYISNKDLADAWGEELSPYVANRLNEYDLRYRLATSNERDECIRRTVDILLDPSIETAGAHRHAQWEEGWAENLGKINDVDSPDAIVPGYFGKYELFRWNQELIVAESPDFERHSLAIIEDWLFDKYLREVATVYEFGCGTGHNLFRVRSVNPAAELWGLDWTESSQSIIEHIRTSGIDKNMYGRKFDFFHPDPELALNPASAVVTIAALEQVGSKHDCFVDFLLQQKPGICIHIEPIGELLDPTHLLDYLSLRYFEKRNYLNGFLERLRQLEEAGKIELIDTRRSYLGSMFIDGYSVVVWRPV